MRERVRDQDLIPQLRPRVLVAEADRGTRALYGAALHLAGFEVIEAADGRTALTCALVEPPSVVLTDIRLPLVDGFALCDILRRDGATRTVPILVVTGETRPNQLARMRDAGADAVLVKPAPPDIIVAELRRLLDGGAGADAALPDRDHGSSRTVAGTGRDPERRTRPPLAKSHARFRTTTQVTDPPALRCPSCDRALVYDHTQVGGVSERHAERWDYFSCSLCGAFQYRVRTRKLRRVDNAS